MDIRPSIIGPDFSINPDLVIQLFEKVQFPAPGIMISSREPVIIFGESAEVGISLKRCTNVELQGTMGKNEANLYCRFEEGQYRVKGLFAERFSNYSIIPLKDGSLRLTGELGNKPFDLRMIASHALCSMDGSVFGVPVSYRLDQLTESSYSVKGKEGDNAIAIKIFYTDTGINIKGNHGAVFVEYTVANTESGIEMKGITKDKYSTLSFELESETEIHVAGKPYQVPVDYMINLYENGVAFNGNTGFFKSEYGFVTAEA